MALWKISVKNSGTVNGVRLEKGMSVDYVTKTSTSPLSSISHLFSSLGHPNFKIGWPYRSNHKVYVVPHPFQVSSPRPAWIEHECS